MNNTVAFSVGTKHEGSRVEETFTFEELGTGEDMDEKAIEKVVEQIFKEWVWSTISFSYSINLPKK